MGRPFVLYKDEKGLGYFYPGMVAKETEIIGRVMQGSNQWSPLIYAMKYSMLSGIHLRLTPWVRFMKKSITGIYLEDGTLVR